MKEGQQKKDNMQMDGGMKGRKTDLGREMKLTDTEIHVTGPVK